MQKHRCPEATVLRDKDQNWKDALAVDLADDGVALVMRQLGRVLSRQADVLVQVALPRRLDDGCADRRAPTA